MLAPGDVDLTGDDIDDLREAGSEVDLSALLSAKGDAEAIGRQLGEFKEKVYAEFDRKFPEAQAKYQAAKLAIMKNVFMHSAIIQPQVKYAQFNGVVSELRKNYRELLEAPVTRELVGLIVPSIEMASNQEIAKDIPNI